MKIGGAIDWLRGCSCQQMYCTCTHGTGDDDEEGREREREKRSRSCVFASFVSLHAVNRFTLREKKKVSASSGERVQW